MINPSEIKKDFPILGRQIHGHDLVYLDNAATTQKPMAVIEAISGYYQNHNANVHRGVHTLSEEATGLYEEARLKVANFVGASPKEIIFTRNSTEAINLCARAWGEANLRSGDEIILTIAEHHSNIVPWQMLKDKLGVVIKFLDISDEGVIDLEKLSSLISPKTKLVSVTHISNVLGIINPVDQIADLVHKKGALLLVDGSQSVPRIPVDIKKTGCDFFVFTGHKMLGPMGIGVFWSKEALLNEMPPFLGGGDMIKEVSIESFSCNDLPSKFEAGTPNVAGAVGLGAAVDYLNKLGMGDVMAHEESLTAYTLEKLSQLDSVEVYGPKIGRKDKTGVIAFNLKGVHPHDLSQILDSQGIAIRAGHHCAMPLMNRLEIPGSARASFYIYNSNDDVDKLIEGIKKAEGVFKA